MRITCYKTMLDDDLKNILVKESSGNYRNKRAEITAESDRDVKPGFSGK